MIPSIVFVSNFYNQHQRPLARELYRLTNGNYRFIERMPMPQVFKTTGYEDVKDSEIVLRAWESTENARLAEEYILNAEVVLNGGENIYGLLKKRLDRRLLTFDVGERWFKKGLWNLISPKLLKSQFYYHLFFYNKPYYRLNSSAFAAEDFKFLHAFKGKMFKWGYFTAMPDNFKKETDKDSKEGKIKILFVARLIDWKHPELAIRMAENLKDKGVNFQLTMFGNGPLYERMQSLIEFLKLKGFVKLRGNIPNEQILEEMRAHDIFVFTSDKNEGWGAVLNEAMSSKCAVVASDEIGSVPYLIDNGRNGLIFKSGSVADLSKAVESLINKPEKIAEIGENAFLTMNDIWSPHKAAENLLKLIEGLKEKRPNVIEYGPCSPA